MQRTALVVDDSMLIRHMVCRYLESRGIAVEAVTNGEHALQALKGLHPDIIITDLQMPQMDGTQLIDALKSQSDTSDIPIVILAGKQFRKEGQSEHRADFVIYKDIDITEQLGRALDSALRAEPAGCMVTAGAAQPQPRTHR
ncbi:MAG TPA: response regulator [Alphaproteobacteria bacterium]|nr:response regulator [Alphaproteobacteria bacterium]